MLLHVLQRLGLLSAPEPRLHQDRLREAISVLEQFPEYYLVDMDPISILRAHWRTWSDGVGRMIGGDKNWAVHHVERPYREGEYEKGWTEGVGRDRVVAHLKSLLAEYE